MKKPDLTQLTDRQLAELHYQVAERTRKNTHMVADILGAWAFLTILGVIAYFMLGSA